MYFKLVNATPRLWRAELICPASLVEGAAYSSSGRWVSRNTFYTKSFYHPNPLLPTKFTAGNLSQSANNPPPHSGPVQFASCLTTTPHIRNAGALQHLRKHYDLEQVQFIGASAGTDTLPATKEPKNITPCPTRGNLTRPCCRFKNVCRNASEPVFFQFVMYGCMPHVPIQHQHSQETSCRILCVH